MFCVHSQVTLCCIVDETTLINSCLDSLTTLNPNLKKNLAYKQETTSWYGGNRSDLVDI